METSFVIASLMSAGADISSTNAMGETALHIAIMQKAPIGAINALAECIDVNTRDASNKTCLHVAAQFGSEEAMETIIFFGGREQRDSAGMTALMYACRRESDVARSLLISTSVDQINHVDSKMDSALDIAVRSGYIETVKALLERGAAVDPRAFLCAAQQNLCTILKLFIEVGASYKNAYFVAAPEAQRILLHHDIAHPDTRRNVPFHEDRFYEYPTHDRIGIITTIMVMKGIRDPCRIVLSMIQRHWFKYDGHTMEGIYRRRLALCNTQLREAVKKVSRNQHSPNQETYSE